MNSNRWIFFGILSAISWMFGGLELVVVLSDGVPLVFKIWLSGVVVTVIVLFSLLSWMVFWKEA